MKILAVDDDPIFLELLVSTLNEIGYSNVTAVMSAMEALHEIDTATDMFDCMLFDIQMPNKDGITLTKEVRQQSRLARTPIVMITSIQQRDAIDQAFAAGANDYIAKPIQAAEISTRLNMLARISELNAKVESHNSATAGSRIWKYSDPVPLEQRDNLLDYMALENYLLTIGRMRMSSVCAFGIELDYSSDLFASLPQDEFVDILNDVCAILLDNIKQYRPLLSYAGSGRFVAVLPKPVDLDNSELAALVNAELGSLYSSMYLREDHVISVKIGKTRRPSLLNGFSPKALLAEVKTELVKTISPNADPFLWKGVA
ncbi:response regulator [Marivita sp. S2033]|uniref:response regulator n=1 Tax=Marivita sp. S2033 TaxID=3373187 RepID=UPI0039825132